MDGVRALLDELMGKERDAPLHARSNRKITFSDRDVCKYELVSICPHQLFRNTKSDLGACSSEIHADHLEWEGIKAEYDKLSDKEKERYGYEKELMIYLDQLIRDMDRKIEKNKERAAAESRPKPVRPDDQRRLDEIKARLDECLQRSMELGETGDVDGSMAMAQQADVYKRQHESLHKQLTAPDRSMSVCEVCGIFISSTDNDARRAEHLSGKQYLGWKKVREVFAELSAKRALSRLGDGEERPRSRSREREPGELPSSGGGGHRSRSRDDRGGSGRSRSRSRGRDRSRERSRRDYDYHRGGGGGDYYDRGGYDRRGGGYDRRDYRDYDRGYRSRDRRY